MQPFTEAQIIENLSPCLRPKFVEIQRQKVYSGEPILYAAEFTGNRGGGSTPDCGFMIFTDRRYLKVFTLVEGGAGISYYRSGSTWGMVLGKPIEERLWVDPGRYYSGRWLARLKDATCWDFRYSTIRGVVRNDYSVQHSSEQVALVELRLEFSDRVGNIYKTFKARDGVIAFELLNLAIEHNGKVPSQSPARVPESSTASDIPQLIKALASLREAGLLTDDEFTQKKQELLGRL